MNENIKILFDVRPLIIDSLLQTLRELLHMFHECDSCIPMRWVTIMRSKDSQM